MKKNLTVFCGARFPQLPEPELKAFLNELDLLLTPLCAEYNLVYGGGHIGLMGYVADLFLKHKAHVTGVIPHYLNSIEIQHPHLSDTQIVDDLHERKAQMEKRADVYLVLPGGVGTLDELCEVLTLQSLNRHQKLICIWNWEKTFDHFIEFVNHGIKKGFISGSILRSCVISAHSQDILTKLL